METPTSKPPTCVRAMFLRLSFLQCSIVDVLFTKLVQFSCEIPECRLHVAQAFLSMYMVNIVTLFRQQHAVPTLILASDKLHSSFRLHAILFLTDRAWQLSTAATLRQYNNLHWPQALISRPSHLVSGSELVRPKPMLNILLLIQP